MRHNVRYYMSSDYNHERLETLQKNYRRAWSTYAAEVEALQSAQHNGDGEPILVAARARTESAAVDYRIARDEMALFLLDQLALAPECQAESERQPEFAVSRTA